MSGEGLFWAFVIVLAVLALASAIVGIVMGAGDQLPAYISIAVVAGAALASFAVHRRRTQAPSPPAQPEAPRYVLLETTWAIVLIGSVIAAALIDGPKRVPWVMVAGIAVWQLLTWEMRRRRANEPSG